MKQRTFWATFMLFLIFFNAGILIISITTFRNNLSVIKERCLREHYFITTSIIHDFTAVDSRNSDIDLNIDSILQSYEHFTDNENVGFIFYKDSIPIFNCIKGFNLKDYKLKESQADTRTIEIHNAESPVLAVSGALPKPYSSYSLSYYYDLSDTIAEWNSLKSSLFLIGAVFSVLLSFCLILLLNRIFRPLKQISETSKSIASGEYKNRLAVTGKDEIAEMGQSFNNMADEIQRQIDELAAAAEQKQQFIDNFAHELRTPLTAILGYAEYMQKTVITDDDKLFATNYIMSESQRLQRLASQLLEMATMKTDELILDDINISDLFKFVHSTLFEKAIKKQIKITYTSEIKTLLGESNLLKSLLINLIENSLKACDVNGEISVKAFMQENSKVITISDNGKGMSEEQVTHSTEAFYRADKSRSRADGGAGLGLSICAQIVEVHNASLSIESKLGHGTTIKITFTSP